MKHLLLYIFFFQSIIVYGQYFPSEHWHEGHLVTVEGDTLFGVLKYDLENDLVQLERNQRIETYSSRKLTYFRIFDGVTEIFRNFYSIPYNVNINYKVPRIFEMLYLGELTLLTRETIVQEAISPTSSQIYGTRRRLSHRYFFVDTKGKVTPFTNRKSELFDVMASKSGEIKTYIKKNKLRLDRMQDLVRITAFYNSI